MKKLLYSMMIATVAAGFGMVCPVSGDGIFYVDGDAVGNNDGSSWIDAFNYPQDALSVASVGDKIRVAAGFYQPDRSTSEPGGSGDRTAAFSLKSGLAVRGGFAGCGEPDPNVRDFAVYETVLSGDLDGDDAPGFVNYDENSYHVVAGESADAAAELDGFTISGGNADGTSDYGYGGGMYCDTDAHFIDCRLVSNRAFYGGGIHCRPASGYVTYPRFTRCSFNRNAAVSDGGGMNISDSDPTMLNCIISNNTAGELGGGQMYYMDSFPSMKNCIFSGNHAGERGGAMYCLYTFNLELLNCTLTGNSAGIGGGGVYISSSSETPEIRNCILWGDSPDEIEDEIEIETGWVHPSVVYSDIQNGAGHGWFGEGCLDAPPRFIDVHGFRYFLNPSPGGGRSPCIDAGDPSIEDHIYDAFPRWPAGYPNGARADMGAYGGAYNHMWLSRL